MALLTEGLKSKAMVALLMLGLALFFYECEGVRYRGLAATGPHPIAYDVTKYGAVGDGSAATNEDGEPANVGAFMQAWRAACDGSGATMLVIPPGKFLLGQVLFAGPCRATSITVNVQGTLLADPDLSNYPSPEWIMFENVRGVTLTGTGLIDAQGAINWKLNDCGKTTNCAQLPTSIKFHLANDSVIDGIKSINPMFFHVFIVTSQKIAIRNVNLTAPFDSPNTDGIHTSGSSFINITNSIIATGDDCVSVGHGTTDISITGVTCGPGHGISIGSLGKYVDETNVRGVRVRNCTLRGTTNGARIKSWPGPKVNQATDIVFEDLVMERVKNPIVIDQQYGKKNAGQASHVKISDVHFRNIRGTSITHEAVSFMCSPLFPCDRVEVTDVSFTFENILGKALSSKGPIGILASCANAKVLFNGKHDGLNCAAYNNKKE